MTEMPTERRTPASQKTWLWMVFALVVVTGFIAWLAASSQPTPVAVVEEEAEDAPGGAATLVTLADLEAGVETYVGQTIRIEDVQVASPMGSQAFWTTLPNGTPFLVKFDSALVQDSMTVQGGDVLTVTGRVHMMSDSVLTAWEQQGAIQDEGQRMEAEFATSFVEASQATRSEEVGSDQAADDA